MTDTNVANFEPTTPVVTVPVSTAPSDDVRQQSTEHRVAEISSLLSSLEAAAAESGLTSRPTGVPDADPATQHENKLVQVRLGIASSLFTALRHKHPQSASHSLRVALGCSSWALYSNLDEETRDTLELAALMHDVGKIGVPDNILLKPSRLTAEEKSIIVRHRALGLEILANCCSSERVMNALRYAHARYDGQDSQLPASGNDIPLEARMLAIVDAFDAMTTDHVYRPARSRERALNELFDCAGSQFDPELVKDFVQLLSGRHDLLTEKVASRWLSDLSNGQPPLPWQRQENSPREPQHNLVDLHLPFEDKLIDSMHDGVLFVDAQAIIFLWSRGAQRLTGVSGEAAMGRKFAPDLLVLRNHAGRHVRDAACPVARSLATSTQLRQRMQIMGRQGQHVAIDLHVIPVHDKEGLQLGATVLLHDAQPEATLEEKCEVLHAEVTKDPMTKVANRAEFDRMQALFIEAHNQAGLPCSLIMVDIDHFKSINDTYGHQAGDAAIIGVADLMKSLCRTGDLVARYGGEEFVVLCADCGNVDAARRAEQIRRKLAETTHDYLGSKQITASFGVTELQSGDTPETMLRRTDRALLTAKEQGRNQVVQLGDGMEKKKKKKWWNFGSIRTRPIVKTDVTTSVPIDIAIEKLRGFVSDHKAKIVATRDNLVELEIDGQKIGQHRRRSDRSAPFRVELTFKEDYIEKSNNIGLAKGKYVRTCINISIRPKRGRNRRSADMAERARLIFQSLKAYLMAKEASEEIEHILEPASNTI